MTGQRYEVSVNIMWFNIFPEGIVNHAFREIQLLNTLHIAG